MKNYQIYVLYLAIAIVIGFLLYKILQRFGILKSKKSIEQEKQAESLRMVKQFNPMEHVGKSFKQLAPNEVSQYAKDIRKAIRGLGTNEEKVYSTFKKFWNKLNISQVAAYYYQEYKSDMMTDIMNDLKEKEKAILYQIINNLPKS